MLAAIRKPTGTIANAAGSNDRLNIDRIAISGTKDSVTRRATNDFFFGLTAFISLRPNVNSTSESPYILTHARRTFVLTLDFPYFFNYC
jgi:hypothetical protein